MTWQRSALHILLATSCAGNLVLGERVTALSRTVNSLTARPALETGIKIPSLSVTGVDGRRVELTFDGARKQTIIYVMSPTCNWCLRNRANIRALAEGVAGKVNIVGVSVAPAADKNFSIFVENQAQPFPIYAGLSDLVSRRLRLRSTPTTILLSSDGVVIKFWEGAFASKVGEEIQQYFGVALPGLASN